MDKIYGIAFAGMLGAFLGSVIWLTIVGGLALLLSLIFWPFLGFDFEGVVSALIQIAPLEYQFLFFGALGGLFLRQNAN